MKVLVTGCYGFLGLHASEAFRKAGHEVVGVDRIRNAVSPKAHRIRKANFPFVELDLCNHKKLFAAIKSIRPDVIVHLAAQYSVPYTTDNMHRYVRSNLVAFCYLLEAAKIAKIPRFIFASSVAVSDAGTPSGLYGATKAFNEHAAHAYTRRSVITSTGLRYGVVYGPMLRVDSGVYRVIREQIKGGPSKMSSDHRKRGQYVDVRDAARITVLFAERPQADRHAIRTIIAHDAAADLGDVAKAAARHLGQKPILPKGYIERPRGELPDHHTAAVFESVGDYPAITLDQGIRDTVDWMKK